MHYLKTYSDSIGISHYLCWRMKSMPAEEVEFYWPQICHLLLTYPTSSNALESFILSRAEESTHSAMLTFWFMQSALRDLTPTRTTDPRPFLICQRVLHKCHEIIFGDPPDPSRSPYRSQSHSPPASASALLASATISGLLSTVSFGETVSRPAVRVNPHIPPALVGLGVMLAGAPGMRGLTEVAGEWAVLQGRLPRDDEAEGRARVEVDHSGGADIVDAGRSRARKGSTASDESEVDQSTLAKIETRSPPKLSSPRHSRNGRPPLTAPPDATMFHLSHPASTAPNLVSSSLASSPTLQHSISDVIDTPPQNRKGSDPFSQQPPSPPGPSRLGTPPNQSQQPFYSVPDFSAYAGHKSSNPRRLHPTDRQLPAEALLATYTPDAQRQLLRSHYCRSEIRFLLLLEDISNRLLVIPKPARISALRAELTSLNHNLPAEICMPLWCAADHSHEEGGEIVTSTPLKSRADRPRFARKKAHSRVVRISPGDSVVLNSAERAPYLLHVEILEGDLDFDPTRRDNRELLKKIAIQEDLKRRKQEVGAGDRLGRRGSRRGSEGFGSAMPDVVPAIIPTNGLSPARKKVSARGGALSTEARQTAQPDQVEEMDLVEQLYGAKLSVRDTLPNFAETLPLPTAPKNKALDTAVWERGSEPSSSRRHSFTPSGSSRPAPSTPDAPLSSPIMVTSPTISNGHLETPTFGRPASAASSPLLPSSPGANTASPARYISMEDYAERMRTAAVMLAQLNASLIPALPEGQTSSGVMSWIPGTGWIMGKDHPNPGSHGVEQSAVPQGQGGKLKLAAAQAAAIRNRIMEEMMALEEERVTRMTERPEGVGVEGEREGGHTVEDEGIVRREINKADPSAAIFQEAWTTKKSRIRASSPWGHLANWDVISVIVKTGADLRQEQLATQLIERFSRIWKEEKCDCWVRFFRILITGETSGLVETITDAVSVHSIKKAEYARRIAEGGQIGHVSLMDHYVNAYGKSDSGRFARARRNFIKSLAGYSIVTYLLQIKDRHNGNILVDRDGHLIHIDFGFMLSNSPGGNMGFEAAPFKLPIEYVEIMGGLDSPNWSYFKHLFKEGFEAARKHSDSLITIVELMQRNSRLDCFVIFGEQTAPQFRDRFALGLTTSAVDAYLERLILNSTGSNYTRLYDTFQYYSQGVL